MQTIKEESGSRPSSKQNYYSLEAAVKAATVGQEKGQRQEGGGGQPNPVNFQQISETSCPEGAGRDFPGIHQVRVTLSRSPLTSWRGITSSPVLASLLFLKRVYNGCSWSNPSKLNWNSLLTTRTRIVRSQNRHGPGAPFFLVCPSDSQGGHSHIPNQSQRREPPKRGVLGTLQPYQHDI